LNLRKLENDRDEPCYVLFGLEGAIIAEFQAIKGNIYEILVEQQVLALIICENYHEGLDERVT